MAKRLAAEEGCVLVSIDSRLELLILNVVAFIAHPISYLQLLGFFIRYAGERSAYRYKIANLFLHANAKYVKARRYRLALIDQGHFQSAISLFEHPAPTDLIRKYLSHAPKPDVLIYVRPRLADLSIRLSGRHYIARERHGEEAFFRRLDVMAANAEVLIPIVDARVRVLEVRAESALEEVYERMMRDLRVHIPAHA